MDQKLPKHDIVLLGAGHTNAHIIRMWRMRPIRDARLTCVSNFPVATYSGMLPGVLAGLYEPEDMCIDLVRLCAASGVRLICGDVTKIDAATNQLHFADRPPLPYDSLSIGVGSMPDRSRVQTCDDTLLPIKPMQTFLTRLETRLNSIAEQKQGKALRIAIVGGGAGGVEIAFCLPKRVKSLLDAGDVNVTLIDANDRLVRGLRDKSAGFVHRELQSRGVTISLGSKVERVCQGTVHLANGKTIEADLVLWATGAVAPPLLASADLPKDDRGFLITRPTLQSVDNDAVFAVGDSGTLAENPTPKAGVYAVRQGPVLWENLARRVAGEPLTSYEPQRGFLKLLNLGNGSALAEYKGTTWHGRWCWRVKDRVDRRFMAMYQDYTPMMMPATEMDEEAEMRCAGCGGKVGGDVLSRVLARLDIKNNQHVLVGLDKPDDVAVIATQNSDAICATTDFFAAPLDDPYITGRVAALNAVSDVFAVAGTPTAALAHVTMPLGSSAKQEQLLYELLAGAAHEFDATNTSIVGGHTIEGPQLSIGFTVLGEVSTQTAQTKDRLAAGDVLVLTKPLGSGVLLAAHMQARCRAEWMQPLLETMLVSNQHAAQVTSDFDIHGMTDVTGFGFAGHLLEMLKASNLAAEIVLADMPLLPGAAELFTQGLESTLAPANRNAESEIEVSEALRKQPAYAALFDPQTSGGMLLGMQPDVAENYVIKLAETGQGRAVVVGRLAQVEGNARRISIH